MWTSPGLTRQRKSRCSSEKRKEKDQLALQEESYPFLVWVVVRARCSPFFSVMLLSSLPHFFRMCPSLRLRRRISKKVGGKEWVSFFTHTHVIYIRTATEEDTGGRVRGRQEEVSIQLLRCQTERSFRGCQPVSATRLLTAERLRARSGEGSCSGVHTTHLAVLQRVTSSALQIIRCVSV
jgi:hypothetical protein